LLTDLCLSRRDDNGQSDAIITASVILMNHSFLPMASLARCIGGDTLPNVRSPFGIKQAREPNQQLSEVAVEKQMRPALVNREAVTKAVTKLGIKHHKQKRPTFR
jgi:hypothetical protein